MSWHWKETTLINIDTGIGIDIDIQNYMKEELIKNLPHHGA